MFAVQLSLRALLFMNRVISRQWRSGERMYCVCYSDPLAFMASADRGAVQTPEPG